MIEPETKIVATIQIYRTVDGGEYSARIDHGGNFVSMETCHPKLDGLFYRIAKAVKDVLKTRDLQTVRLPR